MSHIRPGKMTRLDLEESPISPFISVFVLTRESLSWLRALHLWCLCFQTWLWFGSFAWTWLPTDIELHHLFFSDSNCELTYSVMTSTTGSSTIGTVNTYQSDANCQFVLEGPVGYKLELEVNSGLYGPGPMFPLSLTFNLVFELTKRVTKRRM